MRKGIIVLIIFFLLCGCTKEIEEKEEKKVFLKEEVITYKDENNTPIGIYQLQGNTLHRVNTIRKNLKIEEDIGILQLYPSKEEEIFLNKSFGESYYENWNLYKKSFLKEGFNIKFHLTTGEDVSYNILSPADCMNRWEHLMNYLYDDYANRGKSFYSHIEPHEYTDETLFTSIKLQSSYQISEIDSPILLTVFTYDSDDDFDPKGQYRGNSSYTITICPEGINC